MKLTPVLFILLSLISCSSGCLATKQSKDSVPLAAPGPTCGAPPTTIKDDADAVMGMCVFNPESDQRCCGYSFTQPGLNCVVVYCQLECGGEWLAQATRCESDGSI